MINLALCFFYNWKTTFKFNRSYLFTCKTKIQVKLADPDVVTNPSEYQRLAQSLAELDEVLCFEKSSEMCFSSIVFSTLVQ